MGIEQLDVDDCRRLTVPGLDGVWIVFFFLVWEFLLDFFSLCSCYPNCLLLPPCFTCLQLFLPFSVSNFVVLFSIWFLLSAFFPPPLLWVVKIYRKIIMEMGS